MSRVQPQQVTPHSDKNKEKPNPKSILHVFNPVITLMRVCGVCTGPCVTVENIGCSDNRFRLLHKDGWFHTLYCVLVNSYLWIFTGMVASKVALLVPMSSEWIIAFQIMALNITISGFCTWALLNYRNGIYQSWVKDFYLYEQRHGVHKNVEGMVKKSRMLIWFVMSIGILVPVVVLTCALVIPNVREITLVVDRALGWWNYLMTAVIYFLFHTLLSSSILWPMIGSYSLCSELDVINSIIERYVEEYITREKSPTFQSESAFGCHCEKTEKLKAIIGRHKHICKLISGFGDSIAYLQFATFFMSLPLSCFSLYVIITRMESASNVVLCAGILVYCSLSCIVLSMTGVRVNVKAHSSLRCILKIPTDDLSETAMRAVNQLMSLLTRTTIGYNVYGLFTISPPTLLKILGTLVTYVVVVLQFRQPDCRTNLDTLCQDLVANVTLLLGDMRNIFSCS